MDFHGIPKISRMEEAEDPLISKGKAIVLKSVPDATFKDEKKMGIVWIYSKSSNRGKEAIGAIKPKDKSVGFNNYAPDAVKNKEIPIT